MPPSAFITGSAKRLGAYIARHLAAQGYHLWLHYSLSETEARSLQKELTQLYPQQQFSLIQADLRAPSFQSIQETFQEHSLDLFVHNASAFYPTPIHSLLPEQWEELFAVNTRAPVFLTQALQKSLRAGHNPSIAFIGDIHGERSFPLKHFSAYGASKAALLYLTKQLALELAPHIRVNAVSPGITLWGEETPPEKQEALIQKIPLKRINRPEEIAHTIYFLAQQTSITGAIIPVDGGRSCATADFRG